MHLHGSDADDTDANVHDAAEHDEFEEEGFSLEELSQTYAKLQPANSGTTEEFSVTAGDGSAEELDLFPANDELEPESDEHCPVTPRSIIEAVLMVGRPDSKPITAAEIAGLMRGVDESEVASTIADINQIYATSGRAFWIAEVGNGYRLQLFDDLQFISDRFYGRVREVRLNQTAIDCLALVLYQPGITRDTIDEQRGQPSSGMLNQLVRRQLLEMRREGANGHLTPHYYPTDRLLQLSGLASLEDLPQVEEWA